MLPTCPLHVDQRAELAAFEDRRREICAERPDASRQREQPGECGALAAEVSGERDRGKKLRLGHADLGVRGDQVLLGLANVGAPLEQRRGQPGRWGRGPRQLRDVAGNEREIELARQRGEKVFGQLALPLELVELERRIEACAFRLPDIEVRSEPGLGAPAHDRERVVARCERGLRRGDLRMRGQRRNRKRHDLPGITRGEVLRARRLGRAAELAPEIDLER